MKTKFIVFGLVLTICFSLQADKKKRDKKGADDVADRAWNLWKQVLKPDKTENLIVDAGELRNWTEAVVELYNRKHLLKALDLHDKPESAVFKETIKKFDKNNDEELDRKEERDFKDSMGEIFDNATEVLKEKYDENRNRRLDKSEVEKINVEIPNFLVYSLKLAHDKVETKVEEVENEKVVDAKPPKEKKSIHDVYK